MTTQNTRTTQITSARTTAAPLLRLALKLDGIASGAMGLLLVALGAVLDSVLGLPTSLLVPIGAFLVAYGGAVYYLGTRAVINRAVAWTVVLLNVLWVVDSVLLLVGDWYDVTGLGIAFVVAQALAVAAFAELQYLGLRRSA